MEIWYIKKDMDLGPIPPNHGKFLQKKYCLWLYLLVDRVS